MQLSFSSNRLHASSLGSFVHSASLTNIAILGTEQTPSNVLLQIGHEQEIEVESHHVGKVLTITGIEQYAKPGAWTSDFVLQLLV